MALTSITSIWHLLLGSSAGRVGVACGRRYCFFMDGRTLLNNSCDPHTSDNTPRAESDDNSRTGVHSLGCTTFAYATDKYGAITKVDAKLLMKY